jgi:putative peptidoglycan lipid II flippase
MVPIVLGTLASNINMIIDRTIASRLTEGSITALSFSHRLMSLATEMLIFTIVAVVYATASEFQASKKQKEFNKNINFGINFVILIGIPASVGFIILGKPIVRLFYERGAFTQADTQAMVSALAFYSIGITAICIADLLTKAMFSMKDTKTPVKISIGAVLLNIVLNIILSGFMGHNGLALATSTASVFSMILLMIFFKKMSAGFVFKGFAGIVLKSMAASVVMAAVVWVLFSFVFNLDQGGFLPRLGGLMAIVTIGFAVYILSVYLLKVEEIRLGILEIRKKFGKAG